MSRIKLTDVIGWYDAEEDMEYCHNCTPKNDELKPLTEDDREDDEFIICEECGAILK
jgi:uncharacterized Zn finger protein